MRHSANHGSFRRACCFCWLLYAVFLNDRWRHYELIGWCSNTGLIGSSRRHCQPHQPKCVFVDWVRHNGATKAVQIYCNPPLWRIQLVDPSQPNISQDSLEKMTISFLTFFEGCGHWYETQHLTSLHRCNFPWNCFVSSGSLVQTMDVLGETG